MSIIAQPAHVAPIYYLVALEMEFSYDPKRAGPKGI
jgi:hypothetical protein